MADPVTGLLLLCGWALSCWALFEFGRGFARGFVRERPKLLAYLVKGTDVPVADVGVDLQAKLELARVAGSVWRPDGCTVGVLEVHNTERTLFARVTMLTTDGVVQGYPTGHMEIALGALQAAHQFGIECENKQADYDRWGLRQIIRDVEGGK